MQTCVYPQKKMLYKKIKHWHPALELLEFTLHVLCALQSKLWQFLSSTVGSTLMLIFFTIVATQHSKEEEQMKKMSFKTELDEKIWQEMM